MTKVISLSDAAYNDLDKLKRNGESFSDVVLRLTKREKKPLNEFFGKWPGTAEETRMIEKDVASARSKTRLRSRQ